MLSIVLNQRWELLHQRLPMLRAYIRRLVRNDESAQEVMQETCFRVLRSEAAPEDGDRFSAWCRGVARHVAAREHRKIRRDAGELVSEDEADKTPDPRGTPENYVYACEKLAQATVELDNDGVELLVRRYVYEEKVSDLADERALSPAALRMRLMRLRSALRANK